MASLMKSAKLMCLRVEISRIFSHMSFVKLTNSGSAKELFILVHLLSIFGLFICSALLDRSEQRMNLDWSIEEHDSYMIMFSVEEEISGENESGGTGCAGTCTSCGFWICHIRDIRNGFKVEIIDLLSWEEGVALANPRLSQEVFLIFFIIYLG